MGRFDFIDTPLLGAKIVQRKKIEDSRGFLSRFFCADEFHEIGLKSGISQINHTLTRQKGAVRGLHFQYSPHAETKIVSCLNGEVFDVAVDLRKDSPTFLQWHGVVLSKENQRSFFIPEGFAHGFQTLTEDCELIYLHSAPYAKNAEGALNVLDPKLNINWPLPISDLSERDRNHLYIDQNYQGIAL
ncbi:dTDP-4-dehydrorhamnose 3,5-epimerase [Methylotenera sp.]|uniref:dTDP-4-dehydrorhamnose 3,5-epimerase n=1 Tax=Methylotenera sp. TaxID=2051956 RepID=UPI0024883625|nr:dTDP-4-dehydrorhamnose 3,5-epimerase [Methylotenera sp.]MDI1299691.1 dTDP-4-dehydrorhamnose 3,5-epimerase [Methylotenera sp.]